MGDIKMAVAEGQATLPLTVEEVRLMNAYWRAANYLSVGQIYLYDNPLLRQPLTIKHRKPRLLGHWGATPGLNFSCVCSVSARVNSVVVPFRVSR